MKKNNSLYKKAETIISIPEILRYNMTKNIYTNTESFKYQFIMQSLILSQFNDTSNQTLKEMSPPFNYLSSVSDFGYLPFLLKTVKISKKHTQLPN